MDSGSHPREALTPDMLASFDQINAELTNLVTLARKHMENDCGLPFGYCVGEAVMVREATYPWPLDLLSVAVVRLAKEEAHRGRHRRD